MKHFIVVGSGIAGLIAAIELSAEHSVTLVTKAQLAESNTRWAQGGIAAAMFSDDSVADHIADTLAAGAGLCNPSAVEVLCTEGPARIRDLIRLGVAFDHHNGQLAKGLEAAHSYPRVLHAGGDATGLTIETALVRAVRSNPQITVLEHTFAKDLLLDDTGTVTGLEVITEPSNPLLTGTQNLDHTKTPTLDSTTTPGAPHLASGMWESSHHRQIPADAVILASGGAGQLFLHTTNPTVATGDGVAMALRAGAQLADLEFYQFHPTALATPNLESSASSTFLISEAVRGEGATLLDAQRHRFMQQIHPAAELAPRDIVARGIARQMATQENQPVLLDITAKSPAYLAQRFPSIDAATRARGLDWSTDPIPVTPAAHYWMGGIRTDLHGRTSIPNLYAVGEVACTGVHGANRLASNSLLESLVFAWRCAHLLLNDPLSTSTQGLSSRPESALFADAAERPANSDATEATTPITRLQLQTLMWTHAGIERNATGLNEALDTLTHSQVEGHTTHDLETRNLLDLAHAVVTAALARAESRGAHYRTDFPSASETFQHSLIFEKSGCPMSGSSDMGSQSLQPNDTEPVLSR